MKKNILIFLAGMFTMLLITVILGVLGNLASSNGLPGLTLFENSEKSFNAKQFVIMQTLASDAALAHAKTQPNAIYDRNEILVLLLGDEKANYYDDQKINVPKGKVVKQVGVYQYQSRELGMKTVPAVIIK